MHLRVPYACTCACTCICMCTCIMNVSVFYQVSICYYQEHGFLGDDARMIVKKERIHRTRTSVLQSSGKVLLNATHTCNYCTLLL